MLRKCAFAFVVSTLVLSPMWFKAIGQTINPNPLVSSTSSSSSVPGAVQGGMAPTTPGPNCGGNTGISCDRWYAPPPVVIAPPQPSSSTTSTPKCGGIGVECVVPTITVPTASTTGKVFSIGQAFGAAEPYIDSLTSSLIASLVAAAALYIRRKWNINIDEGQRAALVTFLENQAASLIADGFVKMENKKIVVDPAGLDASANHAANVIPDALKHFDLDGPRGVAVIKEKIIDTIPQTTAGAAIVAQAHQQQAA